MPARPEGAVLWGHHPGGQPIDLGPKLGEEPPKRFVELVVDAASTLLNDLLVKSRQIQQHPHPVGAWLEPTERPARDRKRLKRDRCHVRPLKTLGF